MAGRYRPPPPGTAEEPGVDERGVDERGVEERGYH
jgi:hypothetical protein